MKKFLLPSAFVFASIFSSCGPPAEDRELMHKNAKVFQDSIANMIRTSMDEAAAPGNNMAPAPAPTPTPAAPAK